MKTMSPDTHPDIERFHLELIRKASIFRRLQMVTSLVKTTRYLSWQGICERYPNETQEARIERYVSLLYGDKVAQQVIDSLMKKESNG